MLEFRRGFALSEPDQEDTFLVEVNARPWGSLALARHAGIPFIAAWAAHFSPEMRVIHDRRSRRQELKTRTAIITSTSLWPGEIQHLLSVVRSFHRRELRLQDILSSFGKSLACLLSPQTKYDFFSLPDPGPAFFQFFTLLLTIGRLARNRLQILHHIRENSAQKEIKKFEQLILMTKNQKRIGLLIVCQGNRCRSPFVELLFRKFLTDQRYNILSRGLSVTKSSVPLRFHSIFHHFALNPKNHVAIPLSAEELQRADVVFTMNALQKRQISKQFGGMFKEKCIDISAFTGKSQGIDDPYLLSPLEAKRVFDVLNVICEQILVKIERTSG